MLNIKKSNISTMEEVHKKIIDTMRFTHTNVNFDVKYEGDQNWSKILSVDIMRVFGDDHM